MITPEASATQPWFVERMLSPIELTQPRGTLLEYDADVGTIIGPAGIAEPLRLTFERSAGHDTRQILSMVMHTPFLYRHFPAVTVEDFEQVARMAGDADYWTFVRANHRLQPWTNIDELKQGLLWMLAAAKDFDAVKRWTVMLKTQSLASNWNLKEIITDRLEDCATPPFEWFLQRYHAWCTVKLYPYIIPAPPSMMARFQFKGWRAQTFQDARALAAYTMHEWGYHGHKQKQLDIQKYRNSPVHCIRFELEDQWGTRDFRRILYVFLDPYYEKIYTWQQPSDAEDIRLLRSKVMSRKGTANRRLRTLQELDDEN